MNKYGNEKASIGGMSFGSKLEAAVYQILLFRQKAGEIADIQCQDHLVICGPPSHDCDHKSRIQYVADFKCMKPDGSVLFIEAKGFHTDVWNLKKRLYRHYCVFPLEIWGGSWQKPRLIETIIPRQRFADSIEK